MTNLIILDIPPKKQLYKVKWGSFYGDYKNIHDYMGGIRHKKKYEDMPIEDKGAQGLQKL
jgi:hypothetical protein